MRQRILAEIVLGLAALLCSATATAAASVTVLPSNPNPLPGESFYVTLQGSDFPGNGTTTGSTGSTLTISYDSSVVTLIGATLSPGSPFDFITPPLALNANTVIISVLRTAAGYAFGDFDAYRINFTVLPGAPMGSSADIFVLDDCADNSWTDQSANSIPVTYTQADGSVSQSGECGNIGGDTVPDVFTFTDQADVPLLTESISNAVTISGIDSPTTISISGGDISSRYSVNGAAYTSGSRTINNGDSIRVRHTSAGTVSTSVNTTLNIGGVTDTFTSTTRSYTARRDQAHTSIDVPVTIDVLANDIGFANPVAVSVWTNPASGTVSVSGSPGLQSDLRVAYLPNAGFQGSDSFEYLVEDGARSDIATVDVVVHDPDADHDGVEWSVDNCTQVANPDQFDADGDGYGNMCDADLNGSGLVNTTDYIILRSRLNMSDPVADLNHSGRVTTVDYAMLRKRLNTAPGPSGLCAATPAMPCTPL